MSDQTILSASGFIDSIGVNTHAGFGWTGYNNLALMVDDLKYLGVTHLRDAIRSRAYLPGGKLPTEQEIATAHTVSLTTVRRAMQMLAAEGLVVRRQGAGTFVSEGAAPAGQRGSEVAVGVVVPDTTMYFPRVLKGIEQPSGYTEPLLHQFRLAFKAQQHGG